MAHDVHAERAALLALLKIRPGKSTWPELATEVAFLGSAICLLEERTSQSLLPDPEVVAALESAEADLAEWDRMGLRLVTVMDSDYPRRLLDIRETPPFLFASGHLLSDDRGMSVVGSRHASPLGLSMAATAAELLVEKGLTVIAGLAAGIDSAAHRAALAAGGRTVAFIGTGIRKSYPAENRALQREIEERGLVLSQFLPDAPPTKYNFPMRNATMSGYGHATIVVEAGETSGTRIQARLATQHGRPVILARAVAEKTQWGAALAERRGVYVVAGTGELQSAIEQVLGEQEALRAALRDLAPSAA